MAQNYTNLLEAPDTVKQLEQQFDLINKKEDKPQELAPELQGKTATEIEQIAIEKERARRLKEADLDKDSDDFLLQDPNLSERYQRGSYLVYDCASRHWVCTAKDEYQRCERERAEAKQNRQGNLVCGHFRKFDTIEQCQQKQRHMTDFNSSDRFCLSRALQMETFQY